METLFFFIDESKSTETQIASLTCILVTQNQIFKVRNDLFIIYEKVIKKMNEGNAQSVIMMPPEFHGSTFLRTSKKSEEEFYKHIDDDFRLEIIEDIIKVVNDNDLSIYRIGNTHADKMVNDFGFDSNLYAELYLQLTALMNSYAEDYFIIPVMDYIQDTKLKFISPYVWNCMVYNHLYKDLTVDNPICSSNGKNFLINTVFANSSEHEIIQLVDIISYVLQKNDIDKIRKDLSPFSKSIVEIYKVIRKELLHDTIITIKSYRK